MNRLRLALRLPLLMMLLLVGIPLIALVLSLPRRGKNQAPGGEGLHGFAVRTWSAGMVRTFGFRVRRFGTPLQGAALFVANHVSWVDITLVHSQLWAGFVSKAEVERWPVLGPLASLGGTIYHHRGSHDSLSGVMHQMLERLNAGRPVAVFPEGRATNGEAVGVFHARIFQPAVLAGVPVQPMALRYGAGGSAQTVMAFQPGEHFLANFVRLLGEPSRVAELHFLEPIQASEDGRRRMAQACRQQIVAAMAR